MAKADDEVAFQQAVGNGWLGGDPLKQRAEDLRCSVSRKTDMTTSLGAMSRAGVSESFKAYGGGIITYFL